MIETILPKARRLFLWPHRSLVRPGWTLVYDPTVAKTPAVAAAAAVAAGTAIGDGEQAKTPVRGKSSGKRRR
jgi:hypothetical protein